MLGAAERTAQPTVPVAPVTRISMAPVDAAQISVGATVILIRPHAVFM
jgi:hypothetical protein